MAAPPTGVPVIPTIVAVPNVPAFDSTINAINVLFNRAFNTTRDIVERVATEELDETTYNMYSDYIKLLYQIVFTLNQGPFADPGNVQIASRFLAQIAAKQNSVNLVKETASDPWILTERTAVADLVSTYRTSLASFRTNLKQSLNKLRNIAGTDGTMEGMVEALKARIIKNEDLEFSFDNILGYDDIKNNIKSHLVIPFTVKPLMFYGPPGAGKNVFVEAIAKFKGASIIMINGGNILSHLQGGSEQNVAIIMDILRAIHNQEYIVCLDEADSILRSRDLPAISTSGETVLNMFLTELDSAKAVLKNLYFTTNYIGRIDAAIQRRIDLHLIDYPSGETATNTFFTMLSQYYIYNINLWPNYAQRVHDELLQKKHFSNAQMASVIQKAFYDQYGRIHTYSCGKDTYNMQLSKPMAGVCVLDPNGQLQVGSTQDIIYPMAANLEEIVTNLINTPPQLTDAQYKLYVTPSKGQKP